MGVSDQHHALAALYPQERTSGTHWIGGWVGPRSGLNTEARGKFLCLCQGSKVSYPVCSQTLYLLIELPQILVKIAGTYNYIQLTLSCKGLILSHVDMLHVCISIVTLQSCCVTMRLLHFHSNVTVPVA
jgi:hypothetical protein